MKYCRYCGSPVEEEAVFCRHCGKKIETVLPEVTGTEPVQDEQIVPSDTRNEYTAISNQSASSGKADIKGINSKQFFDLLKTKKKTIALVSSLVIISILLIVFLPKLLAPSYVTISATYNGPLDAGIILNNSNEGIVVTGTRKNGMEEELKRAYWTVKNPVTLEPDSTSTVYITSKGVSCKLTVHCKTSAIKSISFTFDRRPDDGEVLKKTSEGFLVTATYEDGSKKDVTADCKFPELPIKVSKDSVYSVTAEYTDPYTKEKLTDTAEIHCAVNTVTGIEVSYIGSTVEGTVLDNSNSGFKVVATYKSGEKEEVSGWNIKNPQELVADTTSIVKIEYAGISKSLSIECSTLSPKNYKASCTTVSYDELLRNPNDYKDEKIKMSGEIVQVLEGSGWVLQGEYRVEVGDNKYIVLYNYDRSSGNLIEGDHITIYGEAAGNGTYRTILGLNKTVPRIHGRIVER